MWNRFGVFKTYFTEGTLEFPTHSSGVLINDEKLIVITFAGADNTSYLVPGPNVRLNLLDLLNNLPSGTNPLQGIADLNDAGDMVGTGSEGGFLLERTCEEHDWSPAWQSAE